MLFIKLIRRRKALGVHREVRLPKLGGWLRQRIGRLLGPDRSSPEPEMPCPYPAAPGTCRTGAVTDRQGDAR